MLFNNYIDATQQLSTAELMSFNNGIDVVQQWY